MAIDGIDEVDEFSREVDEFTTKLGDSVDDGVEESLDSLKRQIVNRLNRNGINSERWRTTEGDLNSFSGWGVIQLSSGSFTLRPVPAVRDRAVALEFDRDPAKVSSPDTTMTFKTGPDADDWVTITAAEMDPRDENASGWWRAAVRNWESKNNLESETADEIEDLFDEVFDR